jgi:3-oxoacyl-[acyl-carrier-protein] synthase-3
VDARRLVIDGKRGAPGACIRGIAYAYASASHSVRDLAESGWLESDPATLEAFGFDRVHVAVEETPYDLALTAANRLLDEQQTDRETVGLLVYAGTPSAMAFAAASDAHAGAASLCTADRFRYPVTRLQHELGLESAAVIALDQLACTTLFGAIRVARAMMASEGIERALCVASEFYPAHAGREAVYNCTSDAACALLLDASEDADARNRIVGSTTISKGYYWDPEAMREEVIASYFPTAVHAMHRALSDAGWRPEDVDWVIPHNVSTRSWDVLLRLARLPNAKLWAHNIPRRGHALSGDNFINLRDAIDGGDVRPGQRALLFAYGYGAHWTALAVEA